MSADDFDKVRITGEALWGAYWQERLAAALADHRPAPMRGKPLSLRAVHYWRSGQPGRGVPGWVIAALPDLVRAEAARRAEAAQELGRLADKMEAVSAKAPSRVSSR